MRMQSETLIIRVPFTQVRSNNSLAAARPFAYNKPNVFYGKDGAR